MYVEQLYTNCLSEAAYLVVSEGEAAVIDPLRDYEQYIEMAKQQNASIRYVFETHFHADFVSGHLDLSKKTGAPIVYGPETETNFPVHRARNGERFPLGKGTIEVLHTPGHTPESTCYLLYDENGKLHCIFTGDTLFVGDVGRPDLFGGKISKEELASRMYDSLQQLKQLPDDVIVYPAHGPGSSCGKNLGKETWSTLGVQKQVNYALQNRSREAFINVITEGLSRPPQYFALNARINREGYSSLDEVRNHGLKALSPDRFESEMKRPGVVVVDTRHEDVFEQGFIPGSVFIGLKGRFAEWVGTVLNMEDHFLLVTEPGKEEEALIRMARVGYDHVIGFLDSGFEGWKAAGKPSDLIISIDADEFLLDYKHDQIAVLDVRKESEYLAGHVEGATHVALQDFSDQSAQLENMRAKNLYLHCQGGYRSMIAASLLRRKGFHSLRNIHGGYQAIAKTAIPTELPKFSES